MNVWHFPRKVIVFLLLITAFRLWFCTQLELAGDEAYYWLWSKHLDFGYFSKGPGVAWTIAAGTCIFGDTVFGIRCFAVLLAAGTSGLLYILARGLFSDSVAWKCILLASVIPLFAVGSILMTIDPLSVFFWALAALFFWRAKDTTSPAFWILTGAAVGLGSLCKYTNLAELICFALFCLWCPKYRRHLCGFTFPAMALVSLAALTPVLIWNQQHNWVTFQHLVHRGGLDRSWRFSVVEFSQFLGQQAGVISPLVFAGVLVALFWALRQVAGGAEPQGEFPRLSTKKLGEGQSAKSSSSAPSASPPLHGGEGGEVIAVTDSRIGSRASGSSGGDGNVNRAVELRFLLSLFFPLFAFYTVLSFNDSGQANWTAPCYVSGIILLVSQWTSFIRQTRWARGLAAFAVLLAVSETGLLHDTFWLKLPSRRDPLSRLRGSKDLARQVASMQETLGAKFIIANKYSYASLVSFYHPQRQQTFIPHSREIQNQFSFWPGYHENYPHGSAIFVADSEEIPAQLKTEFASVEKLKETYAEYRGRPIKKFYLTLCRELQDLPEEQSTNAK
ncbi:MAG: glycosyltransferase family 39 protein [Verrucomicrobia bacterium]|nr:glycosyltransferase family 39 protein [Verrucomicrobiota bacterium]